MKVLFLTKKKKKKLLDNLCKAWDSYADCIFKNNFPNKNVNILILDYHNFVDVAYAIDGYRGCDIFLDHVSNSLEKFKEGDL